MSNVPLDLAFAALADPTRRAILDRLAREDGLAVTAIAAPFAVSLPAVMKHLDVLARAGLDRAREDGTHGALPPAGGADGNGHAVACPLRALLERTASMRWPNSWRRTQHAHQAKPHPQAPPQSHAGASLQRVGGPGKNSPLVRPASRQLPDSVRAEMDVRAGGRYRISFKTEDGESHEVGGVYREVVPDSRLVFTWAWHSTPERESLVTVTVAKDGDGTMLTLHHEQFFDEKARDGHNARLDRHAGQARALFRRSADRRWIMAQATTTAKRRRSEASPRSASRSATSNAPGRTATSTGTS